MSKILRNALVTGTLAAGTLGTGSAVAGSFTFDLTRSTLGNVNDSQGVTQYEGGTVADSTGATVGYFNITRRVTTGGSDQLNMGGTTVTLFFANPRGGAANSLTMEGAHDFSSGGFLGSVSASSSVFQYLRDADAAYTAPGGGHYSLTVSWTGATPSKLP